VLRLNVRLGITVRREVLSKFHAKLALIKMNIGNHSVRSVKQVIFVKKEVNL